VAELGNALLCTSLGNVSAMPTTFNVDTCAGALLAEYRNSA
jgi:hypothetical protein